MVNVYQSNSSAIAFDLVQRISASPVAHKSEHLRAGYFVLEWEGRIPQTSTPSQVADWVSLWVDTAVTDSGFVGEVGDVYWDVTALWVVANPEEPFFINIFIPVKVKDGDILPDLLPPQSFGFPDSLVAAPAFPLVAILFLSLGITAASVGAVLILAPGEAREVAATIGLALHPDSEALQDLANKPKPPSQVGAFFDSVDNVATAAMFLAAIWLASQLLTKTALVK